MGKKEETRIEELIKINVVAEPATTITDLVVKHLEKTLRGKKIELRDNPAYQGEVTSVYKDERGGICVVYRIAWQEKTVREYEFGRYRVLTKKR